MSKSKFSVGDIGVSLSGKMILILDEEYSDHRIFDVLVLCDKSIPSIGFRYKIAGAMLSVFYEKYEI